MIRSRPNPREFIKTHDSRPDPVAYGITRGGYLCSDVVAYYHQSGNNELTEPLLFTRLMVSAKIALMLN